MVVSLGLKLEKDKKNMADKIREIFLRVKLQEEGGISLMINM